MKISDDMRQLLNDLAEQLKIDAATIEMLTELVRERHPHLVKPLEAISESASGKMYRIYESHD